MHGSQARLVAVQVGIYFTVLMAAAPMIVVVVMVVIMVKIGMGIVYMPGLVVSILMVMIVLVVAGLFAHSLSPGVSDSCWKDDYCY